MKNKQFLKTLAFLLLTVTGTLQAQEKDMKFHQIFPQGGPNPPINGQYFIGQSYLAPLTNRKELNCPVYNVTFEPGCRNNWHSHTGGQLLIVTAGRGYYQEKGQPARELLPGDVVEIAPNVIHWHGAAPDSWFAHLAVECNPQTNKNTWFEPVDDEQYAAATAKSGPLCRLSDVAKENLSAWHIGNALQETDPELAEVIGNFAFDEVQQYGNLDTRTRILVTMASVIALQTERMYRLMLKAALNNGITPVEIREVIFQAIPYTGFAKAYDFWGIANEVLAANGIKLPLESQSVTSPETRFEKGLALQKEIFGEFIDKMYAASPHNQLHIQQALSGNCFGDYLTRNGLDIKMRELLTFSMLISLGGCESQVKSHIQGNVNVGNGKDTLLAVATQLLPYIGYPRTLNALACINESIPENK